MKHYDSEVHKHIHVITYDIIFPVIFLVFLFF